MSFFTAPHRRTDFGRFLFAVLAVTLLCALVSWAVSGVAAELIPERMVDESTELAELRRALRNFAALSAVFGGAFGFSYALFWLTPNFFVLHGMGLKGWGAPLASAALVSALSGLATGWAASALGGLPPVGAPPGPDPVIAGVVAVAGMAFLLQAPLSLLFRWCAYGLPGLRRAEQPGPAVEADTFS